MILLFVIFLYICRQKSIGEANAFHNELLTET